MKILVVGSGGREHAICRAFANSPKVSKLFCANGNAGIAQIAECIPIRPDDIGGLYSFATSNGIDLTFVGGETPLALGIVDKFSAGGLSVIGPNRAAAQLEASKAFAKDFMARHGIPTAHYAVHTDVDAALAHVRDKGAPIVIKADGL